LLTNAFLKKTTVRLESLTVPFKRG
jgi:hypothetical protein